MYYNVIDDAIHYFSFQIRYSKRKYSHIYYYTPQYIILYETQFTANYYSFDLLSNQYILEVQRTIKYKILLLSLHF